MKVIGYVVVMWYGGIPYILQHRDVVNWHFVNNSIKLYKVLKSAGKAAIKLSSRYKNECVKVYCVKSADDCVCGDIIRRWEREDRERIMYVC